MPRSDPYIVIPAYEPTPALNTLVRDLAEAGRPVLVVDDGSSAEFWPLFDELAGLPGVEVLRHAVNLGKGQALKTAFNHFLLTAPDECPGLVTADADGQHLTGDVLNLSKAFTDKPGALWLGSRSFGRSVPLRSRFGNILTRFLFNVLVGRAVSDTQTGLRAIPRALMPDLLQIASNGYEFELEMLIRSVRNKQPIEELPVETVYIDRNQSSHFHPFFDSLKIYFVFLRFSALALTTAGMDFIVFSLAFLVCHSILGSIIAARLVAGTYNFVLGKRLVFRSKENVLPEAVKYVLTVILLMTVSYVLIANMVTHLDMNVILSKALVETSLFFVSFAVLNTFVFRRAA